MSLSALAAKVAPTNAAAAKTVIECFMVLTPRPTNGRVVNAPFSTSVPYKDGANRNGATQQTLFSGPRPHFLMRGC
jgi:hypothetical protein